MTKQKIFTALLIADGRHIISRKEKTFKAYGNVKLNKKSNEMKEGMDNMTNLKMNALAKELDVNANDIVEIDTTTFEIDGYEYLVLNEEERKEHITDNITESLWAFNSSFLAYETDLDEIIFTALSEKYEEANEPILKLIEMSCGIESFVNSATDADGHGHFLAQYDGNEIELDNDLYAYRTN